MKISFVYILKDKISGKYYTGSCTDLAKRVRRHVLHTGGRTTTKGEWALVCYKEFTSLEEVRKMEKMIKSHKGGNSFKKIVSEWSRV